MAAIVISADYGDCTPPAPGTSAIPGRICTLDTGVPWPRVRAELVREWNRLTAVIQQIEAGPYGQGTDAPDGVELRVFGVHAAAVWTLGADPLAPMSRTEKLVTGQAIRDELAVAETLMRSREPGWERATGVLFWLFWITGAEDSLAHPGFDDVEPPKLDPHGS